MEIVINIPDLDWSKVKNGSIATANLLNAVRNGTPLPKGHGKLVDVNSIPEEDRGITVKGLLYPGTIAFAGSIDLEEYINNLPPVIEADNTEETKEPEEEMEI